MRRFAWLLGALALAACTADEDKISDNGTWTGKAADRGAGSTASRPTAPERSGPSGQLRGSVSPLTSAVSGLAVRMTDMGTVIDLPADTLFEFDSAVLTSQAVEQLSKAADYIRKQPSNSMRIIGHTDNKGDDLYNQRLSEARAQAVAEWLGAQVGIRQRMMRAEGMGEKAPVAPNSLANGADDAAGRARNRRVEIILPNK